MESALLLKLVPFLLEDVQRFSHLELLHEVPNEVIDDNILGRCYWDSIYHPGTLLRGIFGC
jgi:hypothetical protein